MNTSTPSAPPPAGQSAGQAAAANALHNPAVRRGIRADPKKYALANGILAADSPAEVKVVVNRCDTLYIPIARMPGDADSADLSAADLDAIQAAGGTASTVGTASSAGSAGTLTTTVSTAASAGSLGCAGTASDP